MFINPNTDRGGKGWTTNVVTAIVIAIAVKFGVGSFGTWTFLGSVINIFHVKTFNFGN